MPNVVTPVVYAFGGILIGTYVVNAILAPIYASNCLGILSYNSPVCSTTLMGMMSASLINYWIYYIAITSFVMWIYVYIKRNK